MIIMHSCGINNNWLMFHVEQINKNRKMFYVEQSRGEQKKGLAALSLSKNPGVDKGPQPLMALFEFGDKCVKSAKSACAARLSLHSVLAAQ